MALVSRNPAGVQDPPEGIRVTRDWAGLIMHAQAQQGIVPHLHHDRTPGHCCHQLAADGHDGVKTGRGFYDWAARDLAALHRKNADKLRRILAIVNE